MSGTSSRTSSSTSDFGHPLVDVAGAGVEQQRVAGPDGASSAQRLGEADDALLVGVGDDQGALAVGEQLLEHHHLADLLEVERGDDVEGLVEHDLLATHQGVEVDRGAHVDAQLAAAGEHVDRVVVVAARKVPKPAGGWASRSTSSLSFMIWSRASRSVWARRSFWRGHRGQRRWVSARRSSRPRECAGRVAQPAAQVGDLGLQEAHLAGELLGAAAARLALLMWTSASPPAQRHYPRMPRDGVEYSRVITGSRAQAPSVDTSVHARRRPGAASARHRRGPGSP